ncbi:MAG: TIM barrel protein [Bryobacterales bacterium]|nr:TIM barrel protein [Bryobacterales bacterium]
MAMTRRTCFHALMATGPLALAFSGRSDAQAQPSPGPKPTGRVRQGVTRGVFRRTPNPMTLDEMCRIAADLGIEGFDLIGPQDFPVLKKYGLVPSMVPGGGSIKAGVNDKANHAAIEPKLMSLIDAAAAAGAPNVIVMAGDRVGADGKIISDEQGMETSVAFLRKPVKHAEDKGVTLCLELLNSKVNHPNYMADHTVWGVELCKRVGSPRMKLLYDIYHMQIMEGDIIRTIRENIEYLAHFHTAGNPGRHEFDDSQELNYRPIAQALAELNFRGFLSHEYTPLKDPVSSLKEAIRVCAV